MLSEKPLKDKILKKLRISDKINKMDRIIWEKSKDRAIGRPLAGPRPSPWPTRAIGSGRRAQAGRQPRLVMP